jgi:ATP/ADP translocase
MRKHVELVGVLFFVWGALFALIGVSFLALAFGTAAIATSAQGDRQFAAGVTAATFAGLAAVSLIWGFIHIWDAVAVRHGRALGRAVAMVIAVLNLVLLPVGTALGVYALWVLTHDDTRPHFEDTRQASAPPA